MTGIYKKICKMRKKHLLNSYNNVIIKALNNSEMSIESGSATLNLHVRRKMKIKSIEEIQAAVQPIADEQSVEIVEIEFKQGKEPALTFYIDVEGGVDLDTCERFHRAVDVVLDELDPTFGVPYTLNVSSPGLDRPFKTDRDYQKAMGQKVEVRLFAPMQGKKLFEGVLIDHDENCVCIEVKGETLKFEKSKIAKISRAIDFDALGL